MPFIAILTKTTIVMQMFSQKASIFAHKEIYLAKKLLHAFSILLNTSFAKETEFNSFSSSGSE